MATYYLVARTQGAGISGLAPVFSTFRFGDGTGSPSAPTISAVAGAGGWYRFAFSATKDVVCTVDLDPEQTYPLEGDDRYLFFVLTADDAAITETRMRVIYGGVTKANVRIQDPVYNEAGKMTAGVLIVYASPEDLLADENRLAEVVIEVTYDEAGNMSDFMGLGG